MSWFGVFFLNENKRIMRIGGDKKKEALTEQKKNR